MAALLVGLPGISADLEVPLERLPGTPEEATLEARLKGDDFPGAMREAQRLLKKSPAPMGARLFVGSVQAQEGEYDRAVATLEQGLSGQDSDVPFLVTLARIHEDRAELGPGGTRRGGMVSYTKAGMEADAGAFRQAQLKLAAGRFERAIVLRPGVSLYQAKRAALLLAAGDAVAAEKAAKDSLVQFPDDAQLWLQAAKAGLQLGHWEDARVAAEHCLVKKPAESEALRVLAGVAAHLGHGAERAEWERKARYHDYVPEFLSVPYSNWSAAVVDAQVSDRPEGEEETDEQRQQRQERGRAEIKGLMRDKSPEATRLLAVIAWHHGWHGETENEIYRELEERKAEAALMAVFDKARSYCTVGSCAPALARLNSDVAFPLILERLPADRNTFGMGLPEALALYRRPEAVPVLGKVLREAMAVKPSRDPGEIMAAMGGRMLIDRCLWALSAFRGADARNHLEAAARQKEWAPTATAALFAQSRDRRDFDKLIKLLKKNPDEARFIAARFESVNLPEAAAVRALVPPEKPGRKG